MAFVRFQDLDVYRLAEELGDSVWDIVRKWDILARDTVGKQLIRAADSIGGNIAEGSGRYSVNDSRRFVHIARGSLCETQHWLRRAFRRRLLTTEETTTLQATMDQLAPMLNAYLKSIGRASSPKRPTKSDLMLRDKRRSKTQNTKHQTQNTDQGFANDS